MLNTYGDVAGGQGIPADQEFVATVIDNNDLKQYGRIRARVPTIFDGIPDDELPWCVPKFEHMSASADGSEGVFYVPEIGAKVSVKFQQGSPLHPIYSGYFVDGQTQMHEIKTNYPDRLMITKLKDGLMTLYDRKEHRLFIRNPGQCHIYIEGNVDLRVHGNVQEQIDGDKFAVVKGNLTEVVEGNYRKYVQGESDTLIAGNENYVVIGERNFGVGELNRTVVGGSDEYKVGGTAYKNAAFIHDNLDGHDSGNVFPSMKPEAPEFPIWEGVNGDARGK